MLLKTQIKNILKDNFLYDRISQNSGMVTVVFYCKLSLQNALDMHSLLEANILSEHSIYDVHIDIKFSPDSGYTYMWIYKDDSKYRKEPKVFGNVDVEGVTW